MEDFVKELFKSENEIKKHRENGCSYGQADSTGDDYINECECED